jgi:hypothetical protein
VVSQWKDIEDYPLVENQSQNETIINEFKKDDSRPALNLLLMHFASSTELPNPKKYKRLESTRNKKS